jgi:hypothetical protein
VNCEFDIHTLATHQSTEKVMISSSSQHYISHMIDDNLFGQFCGTIQNNVLLAESVQLLDGVQEIDGVRHIVDPLNRFNFE